MSLAFIFVISLYDRESLEELGITTAMDLTATDYTTHCYMTLLLDIHSGISLASKSCAKNVLEQSVAWIDLPVVPVRKVFNS